MPLPHPRVFITALSPVPGQPKIAARHVPRSPQQIADSALPPPMPGGCNRPIAMSAMPENRRALARPEALP